MTFDYVMDDARCACEIHDFQPEELQGKNVLFVHPNYHGHPRRWNEQLVRFLGAKISRNISSKVDYIMLGYNSNFLQMDFLKNEVNGKGAIDADIIHYMNDEANQDNLPLVCFSNSLEEKCREYVRKKYTNETRKEKIARAKRIFNKLIPSLAKDMEYEYRDPIIGYADYAFRLKTNENIDKEGVCKFFDYVAECHSSRPKLTDCYHHCMDLREDLEKIFYRCNDDQGTDLTGYLGFYLPVALVVALFVFADPAWDIEIRFAKGKHSFCKKYAGFHLSFMDEEGTVLKEKY